MGDKSEYIVEIASGIENIDAGVWNALANPRANPRANPQSVPENPFISHQFLKALEDTGCVGPGTGWAPQHLVLQNAAGTIRGLMPNYAKSHSQGEYVFDHGWSDAYMRAGGQYYPKLLAAVPFTPVSGPRFLVGNVSDAPLVRKILLQAAVELTARLDASSFHINFLTEMEWNEMGGLGLLKRTDQQFHWQNHDYAHFDDYLGALASRKRKAVKKERRTAQESDIEIMRIKGRDISEQHLDAFLEFYLDTSARKWGQPYLNRAFFFELTKIIPDNLLLIMARRGDRFIAGALNLIGGDTLFGRYWGCTEDVPCLHFEICYYQAIEHAIANKLKYVEAGAQGAHKLARGYLPRTTYSAHYIADPGFRRAISEYLDGERQFVAHEHTELEAHSPFKKG